MRSIPKYIIIDTQGSLDKLIKEVYYCNALPTIDLEALIEQVVDCLISHQESRGELMHVTQRLLEEDYLGSRADYSAMIELESKEEINLLDYIEKLIIELGYKFRAYFSQLKLFEEDYLQYEYHRLLDDDSIILRARR